MTNELRQCGNCIHSANGICKLSITQKYHEPTDTYFSDCLSCDDARNGFCGSSAVYYEQSEPNLEQLESMFDGFSETQPKSKIETREVF